MTPPKPLPRARRVTLWRYFRLFRQDILAAQPDHLYDAKMAEFRTPFFRSYLVNEPELVKRVLVSDAGNFPKSERVAEGLRPLLGRSVFLSNGEEWARQRRIIDPAFGAARLPNVFPALVAAAAAARDRLGPGRLDVEQWAAHGAADAIFRTLFSVPIDDELAAQVYANFRVYQRAQPLVNLGAFFPLPRWIPRFVPRKARKAAQDLRTAIRGMIDRHENAADQNAPTDLAAAIMQTRDPQTGEGFSKEELVDQVAVFFLAGHETAASALAWSLYLLATHPEWQERAAAEAQTCEMGSLAGVATAKTVRDTFREALRLFPPVPMMVREAAAEPEFRKRRIGRGSPVVVSPWHLHRHRKYWSQPDEFDPGRFRDECQKQSVRNAFLPFSTGPRVCPGAGIAMIEGPLFLAAMLADWQISAAKPDPVPVAHLTVRSKDGIWLELAPRSAD